jgi:hypothetical protein
MIERKHLKSEVNVKGKDKEKEKEKDKTIDYK